ncbi:SDR family NAD(P)-dependent oxidoreductase [Streptomyces sp. NPDC002144]
MDGGAGVPVGLVGPHEPRVLVGGHADIQPQPGPWRRPTPAYQPYERPIDRFLVPVSTPPYAVGRLAGKIAFISGTGAGIGRAAALVFAAEGASVFGCDIDEDSAAETVEIVEKAGGVMRSLAPVDLSTQDGAREWIDAGWPPGRTSSRAAAGPSSTSPPWPPYAARRSCRWCRTGPRRAGCWR